MPDAREKIRQHLKLTKTQAARVRACVERLGYEDIASICETISTEEQEMADWLEMQLPMVVRQHSLSEVSTERR